MLKRFFSVIVLSVLLVLMMELISFSLLMGNSIIREKLNLFSALEKRRQELKIAWSQKVFYGGFDPLVQTQLKPFSKYSRYLTVNEHGFIGNKNSDETLNSFPEKPKGVIRIIVLGGSSLAGCGYSTNSSTIPALLEKMLNSYYINSGKRYQVLNFGIPGGSTGLEVIKIFSQLIYFEPDIIICFDGFNDAWYAEFEPYRVGIDHAIINWADFSYKYFELMNGYGRREEYPAKILTFTSSLGLKIKKYLKIKTNVSSLYKKYPFYMQSGFVENKYSSLDNVTYNNLDILASYIAMSRNIKLFCYLQPHTLNGKKVLAEKEKANTDDWFLRNNIYKSEKFRKENYIRIMNDTFVGLESVYKKLDRKYRDYKNINFYSITDIFSRTRDEVFLDQVHLILKGNVIIAKRFMRDIIRSNKE